VQLLYKFKNLQILLIFVLVFTARLEAQNLSVKKAGIAEANGIYVLSGAFNDRPLYVKGNCEIRYKGCHSKWVLLIDGKMMYKNKLDIQECPLFGWELTCATKKEQPALPVFSIIKQEKVTKKP